MNKELTIEICDNNVFCTYTYTSWVFSNKSPTFDLFENWIRFYTQGSNAIYIGTASINVQAKNKEHISIDYFKSWISKKHHREK